MAGVVAGIGGYGNSIGIPTVGGEIAFDERPLPPYYPYNILFTLLLSNHLYYSFLFSSINLLYSSLSLSPFSHYFF
jgi:hypothetical protein